MTSRSSDGETTTGSDAPVKEHWTREDPDARSPKDRRAVEQVTSRREYELVHGPCRRENIGVRKGEFPTISAPVSRAARAREERGE